VLKTPEQREKARIEMLERTAKDKVDRRRATARRAMRKLRFKAKEVRRVTQYRKRKKAEALAAWHAKNRAEREARAARKAEREAKRALDLRKHATRHAGFVDGYNAVTPLTEAELKALSFARRYVDAYTQGAAEKRRCETLLTLRRQAAQPTPAPFPINCG
jgi:hypothetical protein